MDDTVYFKMRNLAFIDGQNLYMGTVKSDSPWEIDLLKFRIYLKDKYHINHAYYFLGFKQEKHLELYEEIQKSGFILMFKQHSSAMLGKKKGNVDSEIVFQIMKKLYRNDIFDQIVLVSGDGDYKMLVEFLIEEGRFRKILFPNKQVASSLYNKLGSEYLDYLENLKFYIGHK